MRARFIVTVICASGMVIGGRRDARAEVATTEDYIIKPGDTCVSIAAEQLGNRAHYRVVHQYNPGLGPLPHDLKAGSIIKLPKRDRAADATLTAARGAVEVRKPAEVAWDPAKRGMDLFRAWRVGARAFSSAEVTFRDASQLFMRENTVVIIYGGAAQRSVTADAELETGALETRLAALTPALSRVGDFQESPACVAPRGFPTGTAPATRECGGRAPSRRPVVVDTPSSRAALTEGRSLITVDRTAATVVANHSGKPAAVRAIDAKRQPRGAAVQVPAGMGSKVKRGELPSKPRLLPPPPTWQASASHFIALGGAGGTMVASWNAIAAAVRYRLVVRAVDGADVAAADVAAPATSVELHRLPAGSYVATIAAIDSEGFESAPSSTFVFEVIGVAVFPPGSNEPLTAADQDYPDHSMMPAGPYRVAQGSRIAANRGVMCSAGSSAGNQIVVEDVSTTVLRCTVNGSAAPPVPIRVVAACDAGGCESGPAPIAVTRKPAMLEVHPQRRHSIEVGGFGGYWIIPSVVSLGRPQDSDHAISNGPVAGARVTALYRGRIGAELEAFGTRAGFVAAPGTATIVGWRGHLVGGLDFGRFGIRLVIGGGTSSLVRTSGRASRSTTGVFDIGLAATLSIADHWLLRVDAREDTVPSPTGRANVHELHAGLLRAW